MPAGRSVVVVLIAKAASSTATSRSDGDATADAFYQEPSSGDSVQGGEPNEAVASSLAQVARGIAEARRRRDKARRDIRQTMVLVRVEVLTNH